MAHGAAGSGSAGLRGGAERGGGPAAPSGNQLCFPGCACARVWQRAQVVRRVWAECGGRGLGVGWASALPAPPAGARELRPWRLRCFGAKGWPG